MTTVINGSYPAVNSDSDATINGLTVGKGGGGVASNTAVGYQAGYSNTTGGYNAFFGYGSGSAITTGSKNTIFGAYTGNQGGLDIRTAGNYIVLSDGDGNPRGVFDGNGAFLLNTNSKAQVWASISMRNSSATAGRAFGIGPDTNNSLTIYNQNTVGVYITDGATSWTGTSDETLKNITNEIADGLNKVCTLRAVNFSWKSDESAKPQVGLIAQDVQKVLPEVVDIDAQGKLGVRYSDTIPLLVAAIKELKAEIDTLKAQLGK